MTKEEKRANNPLYLFYITIFIVIGFIVFVMYHRGDYEKNLNIQLIGIGREEACKYRGGTPTTTLSGDIRYTNCVK